jgi:hypothetical protein
MNIRNTIVFSIRLTTSSAITTATHNSPSDLELTILVLLYQFLNIIVECITRRILCSHNVSSYEIVIPYVDYLDLLRVGLFDLFGELGGGDVFVGWGEGHDGGPLAATD